MTNPPNHKGATRRAVIIQGAGLASALTFGAPPADASPDAMRQAMRDFLGGAEPTPGRMRLDVPLLVENGNSVPTTVTVESAMNEQDFVKRIAIFNEQNPLPNVAIFHLGPQAGRAFVSTRIRLAISQKVTALAEMNDGTFRSHSVNVAVMLAACLEG